MVGPQVFYLHNIYVTIRGVLEPVGGAGKSQLCTSLPNSTSNDVMLEAIETGQNGCIYTREMDKCYKLELILFSGQGAGVLVHLQLIIFAHLKCYLIKINKVQCFNIWDHI